MRRTMFLGGTVLTSLLAIAAVASAATPEERKLLAELKNYPYRIVHKSYRDNHWALIAVNADGSNPVTLTRTPGANEMYPHVSPDSRYVALSRGPTKKGMAFGLLPEMVGATAKGWNIRVADAAKTNRWVAITSDGQSNKEPDWMPVAK